MNVFVACRSVGFVGFTTKSRLNYSVINVAILGQKMRWNVHKTPSRGKISKAISFRLMEKRGDNAAHLVQFHVIIIMVWKVLRCCQRAARTLPPACETCPLMASSVNCRYLGA